MNAPVGVQDTEPPTAPVEPERHGLAHLRPAELDGVDRQRRRCQVRRLPLDHRRLHAQRGEPHRAADRDDVHRHDRRDQPRHLLLPGRRRGRERERQRCFERGERARSATRPRRRAPGTLTATGAIGKATLSLGRGVRQRRRRALRRLPLHDGRLHAVRPATGSRSRPGRATPTRRRPGTYFYKVAAEDAAGNVGPSPTRRARRSRPTRRRRRCPPAWPRTRLRQHGQPELDRVDRQRRRAPLQRPPLDDERLHADGGEPDRAAHGHELLGCRRSAPGPTTTRSPPRTRPATSAARRTRRPPSCPWSRRRASSRPTGFDEGIGHDDRRPVGQRQHRLAGEHACGRPAASTATRCSFNGTNARVNVDDSASLRPDERR